MIDQESKLFIAGGISRAVAVTIFYPIDTIKSKLQNSHTKPFTDIYKGYRYTIASQAIYGMFVFGTYENLKQHLGCSYPNMNRLFIYVNSAIISDLIGSIFLCPCEVIKQNVQVGRYKSVVQAVRHISYNCGIAGFYKGYSGLLARDIPFRAIQLPLYDKLKSYDHNPALTGAAAGMTAAAITTPIDVIKTHMMCNTITPTIKYTIANVYKTKGISGFLAGIVQRVIYLGGTSMVFFVTFEKLKYIYN